MFVSEFVSREFLVYVIVGIYVCLHGSVEVDSSMRL